MSGNNVDGVGDDKGKGRWYGKLLGESDSQNDEKKGCPRKTEGCGVSTYQ